jgi:hypothetical protein
MSLKVQKFKVKHQNIKKRLEKTGISLKYYELPFHIQTT